MRRFITMLLFAITAAVAAYAQKAQYKVEESSARKMPEWVMSTAKDYLIVTATGGDIEEAKTAVIENVKKQIAQSIATRIVAESDLRTSAFESDDSFSKTQSMETSVMSRTAKLPFIGEIALSKAADYYWERRYYRSTGRNEYFYAVKYPFSEYEMKRLVSEYRLYDKKLDEQLSEFETGLDFISSIEEIGENINKLKVFLNEFDVQDPRYDQVQILSNRYRELYDQITIDWFQEKKGMVVVSLTLGGRSISTSQRPVLKSNCATRITSSYEGNALVIRYNDDNCYDEDENYIELHLKAGNKYISERIFFKSTVDISLTGIVTDAATGEPVAYARLTLIPGGKTATTGRNGMFVYNDIVSGDYSIQVAKAGYKTVEKSVSLISGTTTRTDIILSPDGSKDTYVPPVPVNAEKEKPAQTEQTVQPSAKPEKDPANTVRNGLAAYFRFNGSTRSEVSAIQGNPVNGPQYTTDSPDGTQAVALSSIDGSQISFPKPMIVYPAMNYSITFWMKGFSDGHVWSLACGDSRYNYPKLTIKGGMFYINNRFDYNGSSFNHQALNYGWHFIAVVVKTENYNTTACLYIDGVLIDSISLAGAATQACTKFLLGGESESGDNAIDTSFDNLRIYNSRALSDEEVAQIYMSEH